MACNGCLVVTPTLLYRIRMERPFLASAEIVAVRNDGKGNRGRWLRTVPKGCMLAVGTSLVSFCAQVTKTVYVTDPRRVPKKHIRDQSAPIVALFRSFEEADRCFASDKLVPNDPRWRRQTGEVLDAIGERNLGLYVAPRGDQHPLFRRPDEESID